jgi:hypothetical protein
MSKNDKKTLYNAISHIYDDVIVYHAHVLQINPKIVLSHDEGDGKKDKEHVAMTKDVFYSNADTLKMQKTRTIYYDIFECLGNRRLVYEKMASVYKKVFWVRCSDITITYDKSQHILTAIYRLDPEIRIENTKEDETIVEKITQYAEKNGDPEKTTNDSNEENVYLKHSYFDVLSKLIFKTNVSVRMALHESGYRNDRVVFMEWVDKTLEMMLYYYIILKCGCAAAFTLNDDRLSVADVALLLYDVFGATPEEHIFLFYSWWTQYKDCVWKSHDVQESTFFPERSKTKHVFTVSRLESTFTLPKRTHKAANTLLNDIVLPPSHGDDRLDAVVTDLILADGVNSKMRFINLYALHHLEEYVEKKQVRCANYYIYRNKKERRISS